MSGPDDIAAEPRSRGWHLQREVPLAIIATLLIQTGGIIWWARGIQAHVDRQDADMAIMRQSILDQRNRDAQQDEAQRREDERREVTLRDAVSALGARLDRFDTKLDRISEQLHAAGRAAR
jgi:hypothetical protein